MPTWKNQLAAARFKHSSYPPPDDITPGLANAVVGTYGNTGGVHALWRYCSGTAIGTQDFRRFRIVFEHPFKPYQLSGKRLFLQDAERVQVAPNTLTCRVERDGSVLLSFFGGLGLGQVVPHHETQDTGLRVASLLAIAGTKAAVVQKRAEVKDYLDMDALLRHGVDLPTALAAGAVVYGRNFNPLITLKALSYFDDVPTLPADIQARLSDVVAAGDETKIPALTPYTKRPDHGLIP